MKYKVGDRVKVREDLIAHKAYGTNIVNDDMFKLRGQIVTIEEIHSSCYLIKNDGWAWTDEMFSGLAEPTFNDDIDTIGHCANCGVEFHIHKEPTPLIKTDSNAPAYSYGYCTADGQCRIDESGLTKREYIAGLAMQGLLAGNYKELASNIGIPASPEILKYAVKYADALITELNKPKP